MRPATTVDPRRFSMYNNDLINLATDPEGPGHNTTLADVQDVRHLETSRQDDGTVPLSNLGRFLDMATIQAFGQQPTDDGIVFLGSSDAAALVMRVHFVRGQQAFTGTMANDAIASILCTNPSVASGGSAASRTSSVVDRERHSASAVARHHPAVHCSRQSHDHRFKCGQGSHHSEGPLPTRATATHQFGCGVCPATSIVNSNVQFSRHWPT